MSSSPSYSSNSLPSVLINFILHCFVSLEQIVNLFRIRIQCISVHDIVTSLSNNRLKVNCSCNFTSNMVSSFSHNNRLQTNISLSLIEIPIKSKKMLGTGWEFIIWSLEIIRLTQPNSWSPIKKNLVIKILIFFTCVQFKVKIINFTFLEFSGSGPAQYFYQWLNHLVKETKPYKPIEKITAWYDCMCHVLEHNKNKEM